MNGVEFKPRIAGNVRISGNGLAACCCARLLRKSGFQAACEPALRPKSPILLLSNQTQSLLTDVFECGKLFEDSVIIRTRIVLWARLSEPRVFPHSGLVIPEGTILNRIWASETQRSSQATGYEWEIVSSHTPSSASAHHFGSRLASTISVELKAEAKEDACYVESLEDGWLFLLPCGTRRGSLISVGALPEQLLYRSRLIARQILRLGDSVSQFPAFPRIIDPLCGSGWIACGTAALTFDPLCGEGAGNALREAILASALISAIARGFDEEELFAHYSTRLVSGFLRHLNLCQEFYRSASCSPWWETELNLLCQGVEWSQCFLSKTATGKYRLVGFELEKIA